MLFISCKKEDVNNTNKVVVTQLSENDFYSNYAAVPNNGNFNIWVQGLISLNAQGSVLHNNSFLIHGSFYDSRDSILPGGAVSIDSFHFPAGASYSLQQSGVDTGFFGRNITAVLVPPPGQAPQFSANIYMPKVIYARAGADIKNIQQPTSDTLFWNADAANVNGIELKATYDPSRYINKPVLSSYPVPVIKTVTAIADNGSYIIPKSLNFTKRFLESVYAVSLLNKEDIFN